MKEYTLLKNKVYLYLLAYYDDELMPSAVKLANEIGITRQTVSKKIKELKEEGYIVVEDKIVQVDNAYQLDKVKLKAFLRDCPNYTLELLVNTLLLKEEDLKWSEQKISKKLKVSMKTLENERDKDVINCIIYGILSEGIIKYVGSTDNFELRKEQHMRKRPFLNVNSFVILKEVPLKDKLKVEKEFIKAFDPEWNRLSKED